MSRHPFTEPFHSRAFGGLLESHNWISTGEVRGRGSAINDIRRMQSFSPVSLLTPFRVPASKRRLGAREPIFRRHCLAGYMTSRDFPFFPRSLVSPSLFANSLAFPTQPLFSPPFPLHPARSGQFCHRRVVTARLYLSLSFLAVIRSTPPDALRHSRAVLLAAPTSSPSIPQIQRRRGESPFPLLFPDDFGRYPWFYRKEMFELHARKQVCTTARVSSKLNL